jgi:hypothetical protein
MTFTRDDLKLWFGLIGGVLTAVIAHFDLFPWMPESVQNWVEFVSFLVGVLSGFLMTSPLPGEARKAKRGKLPNRLASILVVGALGTGLVGVAGCGGSVPVPNLPVIVAETDQDVRAAQMKVYGILQAAGDVLNQASIVEDALAKQGTIPAAVHAQLRAAFTKTARTALATIAQIDQGHLKTWSALKARIDPIVQDVATLLELVKPSGHPRLTAIVEALGQIVAGLLLQGAAFGGRS